MPRYPRLSPHLESIGGNVYSSLAHRMAACRTEVYPLHVGDTWLEPADGCRMQDLTVDDHPGLHRYAPPRGRADLLEAIAARVARRSGLEVTPGNVLMGAGATGGLDAVLGALAGPGDEVLVLAPYWPLIVGIVRGVGATPVAVAVDPDASPAGLVAALDAAASDATVAVYLSTPNNPSGRVFPGELVRTVVEWGAGRDLWVLSDEVYEDYVYAGEHVPARPFAPERTFSVHSFSKAFGMAGNRCGYVVGPAEHMDALCKVSTHAFYSTPTASQVAALRALDGRGDAWIDAVRPRYAAAGRAAAARLGVAEPEGSTFLFLDVSAALDARGLIGFLEDCADDGLFLAPGTSFGSYPNHVRICFTSAPPEAVARGVERLARRLGR